MNPQSLIAVFQRQLRRSLPTVNRNLLGILLGSTVCSLALLLFRNSEGQESRQIFRQEGHLDFKNASILGNPTRVLLEEEESHLERTQRRVLDGQNQLKTEVEALRSELQQLKKPGVPVPGPSVSPSPSPNPSGTPSQVATGEEYSHTRITDQIRTQAGAPRSRSSGGMGLGEMGPLQREKKPGISLISFPVKSNGKAFLKKPAIILPSGSYVKATLLTGIEAPEGKIYPVLMQLDFAYVIPNSKKLDLAGCFMIAKAQGDLSTERVQMQASKLSCVSRKGGMFEREVNGFVADDVDNSFAVIGRVNTKQDRVATTAFLASIVSGIGKAIQQAQTTQQTTPLGGAQSVITGDQAKYIGAGGVSESAAMVTQWYLKQAQSLLPTINVGSGQEVWIVMQDQVDLPKDYFTQNTSGGNSNASIFSYFTRLVD